ncbi:hypothetical protein [Morganella phage Mecenats66]|nr:hypothetical protein [Morganella phage Mecenats66]
MWIFTSNGMISAVCQNKKMVIRAREKNALMSFIPGHEIIVIPNRDYMYRVIVSRAQFMEALITAGESIDYPNFKDSIPAHLYQYHNACHQVWSVMAKTQPMPPYSDYKEPGTIRPRLTPGKTK